MHLALIAAVSQNGVIGIANNLPWSLPSDLLRFRELTVGKVVIMGRKTYESIGKPLPNRQNIVVTKSAEFADKFCYGRPSLMSVTSLLSAVDLAASLVAHSKVAEEVMVIGGRSLFAECLPTSKRFYLTTIESNVVGDVLFPSWNRDDWTQVSTSSITDSNSYLLGVVPKVPLTYTFEVLEKR